MHSQIYSKNPGAEEISHHLLHSLIFIILKQLEKPKEKQENAEYFIGNRIKKYIDDHYSEDLTLKSIGSRLHISPSYLCNIFKKTTGYSPMQYIMNRRIGKAQSLLIGSEDNVTDIALTIGYSDSNYFTTIFTKTVGMSPMKYRKRWLY